MDCLPTCLMTLNVFEKAGDLCIISHPRDSTWLNFVGVAAHAHALLDNY